MSIINKGILNSKTAFLRQVGNDWPTAQVVVSTTADVTEVSSNLYFTNARVVSALIPGEGIIIEANGRISANVSIGSVTAAQVSSLSNFTTANLIESSANLYFTNTRVVSALIAGDYVTIEANGRISANVGTVTVQAATQVNNLDNLTTANLAEGTNLYYTNARVRSAISAGKGIIIDNNGVIKNTGSTPIFNTDINGAGSSNVLATMDVEIAFPSMPATDRFFLRSLLVVNLTESTAQVSGNILYATGNTAFFANKIPIPAGGLLEFYEKGQLFQAGDKVNLLGFDAAGVPTSNILNAIYAYESFPNDIAYIGTGSTLAANATNIQVYDSASAFSIIESIKVVNLGFETPKVRLYWADANGSPKGYFAYGTPIPVNTTIDFLQTPKRLEISDKLFAYYTGANANSVSVFVSAKTGPTYTPGYYTANVELTGTVSALFGTTENDGTLLYYTIE